MKKRLLSILLLLTIIFTSSITAISGPGETPGPGPVPGRPRIATITTPCPDYEDECDIDLE